MEGDGGPDPTFFKMKSHIPPFFHRFPKSWIAALSIKSLTGLLLLHHVYIPGIQLNQCIFYPLLCWFIFGDLGVINWVRINSCDATLIEIVPWIIQMLVSDWAQKIFLCSLRSQFLSCFLDLLIWRSFPATSTICWTCLACAESCLQEEFSVKMEPTKLKKFYNWYIFHINSYIYYACSKFLPFHTNMYSW